MNVVQFPLDAEFETLRRAYVKENERIDRLEYAGKRPRPNRKLIHAYYAGKFKKAGASFVD